MEEGSEPISDDELLYRRVPVSAGWFDATTGLKPEAFAPHRVNDATGLSVYRAKYKSIEEAATGRPGKAYYVAVLRAEELKGHGITVVPRPLPGDPGHSELADVNSSNRKTDQVLELQRLLIQLCHAVIGPFPFPAVSEK